MDKSAFDVQQLAVGQHWRLKGPRRSTRQKAKTPLIVHKVRDGERRYGMFSALLYAQFGRLHDTARADLDGVGKNRLTCARSDQMPDLLLLRRYRYSYRSPDLESALAGL